MSALTAATHSRVRSNPEPVCPAGPEKVPTEAPAAGQTESTERRDIDGS